MNFVSLYLKVFMMLILTLNFESTVAQKSAMSSWQKHLHSAEALEKKGKYKEANQQLTMALRNVEKSLLVTEVIKIDYKLATNNLLRGLPLIAEQKFKKTLALAEKSLKSDDPLKGDIYYSFGRYYFDNNKLTEAEKFYLKALTNFEINYGTESEKYTDVWQELGFTYGFMEQYEKALPYVKKTVQMEEQEKDNPKSSYYVDVNNLILLYSQLKRFEDALQLQRQNSAEIISKFGKESTLNAYNLYYRAIVQNNMVDYEGGIESLKECLEILQKTCKQKSNLYGYASNWLTWMYLGAERYNEALNQGKIAVSEIEKIAGKNDPQYLDSLIKIASLYNTLFQYDKSLEIQAQIASLLKQQENFDVLLYCDLLTLKTNSYQWLQNYKEANEANNEAINLLVQNNYQSNIRYLQCLKNKAYFLGALGDNEQSLSAYFKAWDVCKKSNSYLQFEADIDNGIAGNYLQLNKFQEAVNYAVIAADKEFANNNFSLKYISILENLAEAYRHLKADDASAECLVKINEALIYQVNQLFTTANDRNKPKILRYISKRFQLLPKFNLETNNSSDKLNELYLDDVLTLKGFLLKSKINLLSALSNVHDLDIQNSLSEYSQNKKLYSKWKFDKTISINALDSIKTSLTEFETKFSMIYSNHYKNNWFVKDWHSIRDHLKKKEIAIEFSYFTKDDKIIYTAAIIKLGLLHPKVLNLFEGKNLLEIISQKSPNELYALRGSNANASAIDSNLSKKLYDLIWKPLEAEIGNATTIYFSPDGLLYQVPFKALSNGRKTLSEKYDLWQVSSIGIIADNFTNPIPTDALFIGGINYDYKTMQSESASPNTYSYLENPNLDKKRATRGGSDSWNYLPGTLNEIDGIELLFIAEEKIYKTLSGDQATESAFKGLSGSSPKILHIATHGFFFENLPDKKSDSDNQYKVAEDPLLRSGLILAGANQAWLNGSNPYEEEDGILTSMEISNLDLSKTDMVVLSACDTGLGDIDGSEGVYGLQRAFKMAGVKIIVMSLWQVPDTETAEFMKLFYGNWLKGGQVREAFNNAQKTMMKRYKSEPLKWAGFVMFE